jgi:hypothetical protein
LIALLDYLSPSLIKLEFDPVRKGENVTIIKGTTVTNNGKEDWQPAFTASTFSRGIHSCTFSEISSSFNNGNRNNVMVGISGVKYRPYFSSVFSSARNDAFVFTPVKFMLVEKNTSHLRMTPKNLP